MKNVLIASIAIAVVAANTIFCAFAFSDEIQNISATKYEAQISQEEISQLEDITKTTGTEHKMATCIPEGAISENKAIEIAKNALTEKYGVQINHYEPMAILTVNENPWKEFWFVSFVPKNIVKDDASVESYIMCVDLKGEIISTDNSK